MTPTIHKAIRLEDELIDSVTHHAQRQDLTFSEFQRYGTKRLREEWNKPLSPYVLAGFILTAFAVWYAHILS